MKGQYNNCLKVTKHNFFCKKTKLLDFRQRQFPVLILMTAVKSYQVMTNLVIEFSYDNFWYHNNRYDVNMLLYIKLFFAK